MTKGICSAEDCASDADVSGMCWKHYRLLRKATAAPCSIDECEDPIKTREMCSRHYQRWLKANESWRPKGPPHTAESRAKLSAAKMGANNPQYGNTREKSARWIGDKVGYHGVHSWMSAHYGQPKHCEQCGTTDPDKRYEWANISGEYRRDRADFKRLCKKCHNNHDGVNAHQVGAPARKNRPMKAIKGKPVSSKYKGVRSSGKQYDTWRATLRVDGKLRNLGTFKTEEEAAHAYNEAVMEAHGDDAYINEVA